MMEQINLMGRKGESNILRVLVVAFLMILVVGLLVAVQSLPPQFNSTHRFIIILLMVVVIFFALWLFIEGF